ncbi:MAG: flagellar filament capping protein FliD, partial [Clostridiales bacterium]|nr:flagellar filament capping protein FliD [Clostridiales bacterium]
MINPLNRSTPTRMMGLASGMDTDFIIQQTLKLHQMKIDSRMRARTILEWRQATQTSVRDQIQGFRNTFLTTLGSSGMLSRGAYSATSVSVTGLNAGAVSVRASTSAAAGTIRIDQVVKMAKGAKLTSIGRASSTGQGFSMSARLDSLQFANEKTINWGSNVFASAGDVKVNQTSITGASWSAASASGKVRIDGEDLDIKLTMRGDGRYDFTLGSGDEEIAGIMNFDSEGNGVIDSVTAGGEDLSGKMAELFNRQDGVVRQGSNAITFSRTASVAQEGGGTVTVEQRANSANITTATADGDYRIDGAKLDFYREAKIVVDKEEITLRSNMTISSMISEANKALSDKGIKMSYDSRTDRFAFESSTIGGASFEASGQALAAFGFTETAPGSAEFVSAEGSEAEIRVTINGVTDTITSATNSFNLGDATITLNNTTEADEEPIMVTLKRDASAALEKIKAFVNVYNSIIARIEGLVRERKSPNEASYGPLTAEEKGLMTDKQIEEWEAIAKKGILRNDTGLQNLATSLRRELYAAIDSTGLSPQAIGITTGRFDSGMGGQILLDEDKLLAVLEEDPDKVADIFAGTTENRGLLWRMNDLMGNFVSRTQP